MLAKAFAIVQKFERLPIPTVVAVRGLCLGGGCELMRFHHIVFVGEGAGIGQVEAQIATSTLLGGASQLVSKIGAAHARRWYSQPKYTMRRRFSVRASSTGLPLMRTSRRKRLPTLTSWPPARPSPIAMRRLSSTPPSPMASAPRISWRWRQHRKRSTQKICAMRQSVSLKSARAEFRDVSSLKAAEPARTPALANQRHHLQRRSVVTLPAERHRQLTAARASLDITVPIGASVAWAISR